jgi:hypothetical protein
MGPVRFIILDLPASVSPDVPPSTVILLHLSASSCRCTTCQFLRLSLRFDSVSPLPLPASFFYDQISSFFSCFALGPGTCRYLKHGRCELPQPQGNSSMQAIGNAPFSSQPRMRAGN